MIISPGLTDQIFKRKTEDIPSLGTVVFATNPAVTMEARLEEMYDRMRYVMYESKEGGSKWERIGQPMVEHVVDIGFIIWPTTPPKIRQKAVQRTIERIYKVM